MLLYPVRKNNSGFTLIEVIVVTIIVGIIAAISVPNFFSLLQRNRVTEALSSIEGALREGQKQAERDGSGCDLTIDTANDLVSGGCLLNTRTLTNNVELYSNVGTLSFSAKGTASAATLPAVMVVQMFNGEGTDTRRCLIINSLGIIKTGDFTADPSDAGNLVQGNCDS
ncbi:MAG: prepilin-type N-terminal cleavage/methylation domain-containing protein [Cyanobacteria bacterium P01_A01_bin.40]